MNEINTLISEYGIHALTAATPVVGFLANSVSNIITSVVGTIL